MYYQKWKENSVIFGKSKNFSPCLLKLQIISNISTNLSSMTATICRCFFPLYPDWQCPDSWYSWWTSEYVRQIARNENDGENDDDDDKDLTIKIPDKEEIKQSIATLKIHLLMPYVSGGVQYSSHYKEKLWNK